MSGWDNLSAKPVKKERRSRKPGGKNIEEPKPVETPTFNNIDFVPIEDSPVTDQLKIGIYGEPGSGKSHFCATMPEPIFVIDTENEDGSRSRYRWKGDVLAGLVEYVNLVKALPSFKEEKRYGKRGNK